MVLLNILFSYVVILMIEKFWLISQDACLTYENLFLFILSIILFLLAVTMQSTSKLYTVVSSFVT